jgi:hypothetical protein
MSCATDETAFRNISPSKSDTDRALKVEPRSCPNVVCGSKCEILAASKCFPLFPQQQTFVAASRRRKRITLTMPGMRHEHRLIDGGDVDHFAPTGERLARRIV